MQTLWHRFVLSSILCMVVSAPVCAQQNWDLGTGGLTGSASLTYTTGSNYVYMTGTANYGSGDNAINVTFGGVAATPGGITLGGSLSGVIPTSGGVSVGGFTTIFSMGGSIANLAESTTLPQVSTGSLTISHTDMISVYSPVATTIELPMNASPAQVYILETYNESTLQTISSAYITASIGSYSAMVGGSITSPGTAIYNSAAVVDVPVAAGTTVLPMTITASLSGTANAQGSELLIASSQADESAPLTVGNFTGLNGSALPPGLTITGLTTGIPYIGPTVPAPSPLLTALLGVGPGLLWLRRRRTF